MSLLLFSNPHLSEDTKKKHPKILIFRTDRLGDLILSFPVIENLRLIYPKAQIDMFVSPYTAPLAKLQRNIDNVRTDTFPGFRGLISFILWLRSQKYDIALYLYPRLRLAMAGFLARIPERTGTRYRYYSFLFNRRVAIRRSRSEKHERELNLQLLQGPTRPQYNVEEGIEVPHEADQRIQQLLSQSGITHNEPYIILHPGSGGSSLNWPMESFAGLAHLLLQKGFKLLLTGTDRDRTIIRKIMYTCNGEILDMSGKLDLIHLAALLKQAYLVITNSTGPLHLADAVGTHVVGLYSPVTGALPYRWGPYHQLKNALMPQRPVCSRCEAEKCKDFNCMRFISVEEVEQKIIKIWEEFPP